MVAALELLDRLLREPLRALFVAGVEMQGAAATRSLGSGDVVALRGKNPGSGVVHLRKEHSLDAALQEPDSATPLAGRG